MSFMEKVTQLVENFNSQDDAERTNAREELCKTGKEAAKTLYALHFRMEDPSHTEIYKVFAAIGDDLFAAGGTNDIPKEILKAMQSGAKKSRQYASEEVYSLSVEALAR